MPQQMLDLAERTSSRFEVVDQIMDVGEASDGLFFRVKWEGLPDKRDWTWQSATELYGDIPDLFTEYLRSCNSKKVLVSKIKRQLNIS